MKIKSNFLIILTGLTLSSCSQKIDYEAANTYILKSAQEWAEAINEGDSSVIDRIVADDFVGVSLRGDLYDKQTLIRESKMKANRSYKPKVFNVTIRFYGEAAVAQGNETWTKKADSTSTTNIWTDTWIYRDKKWQIVAAQDLKLNQ
ncbi:nuclear transport factor 2 family protein [Aquiflexum sp. TKW24L]|uniref:nuclear transport factor 2 family protein n=1 Tax=Aquiflexum sp. TKW24L TaxID=2942212 RepID=UPI0020BE5572|nr:nuclear transport factor 2 family protein [Aquiflexum sp. TKW24L]MCL6257682.1 nuclear transport factor 2 family protein [Aquiflexum sp. TKW24L]